MYVRKAFVTFLVGLALILGLAFMPRLKAAKAGPQVGSRQISADAISASSMRVTLGPSRDNTLYADEVGGLSNGAGEHFFVGNNNKEMTKRGVIAFDVAGSIPAGSTILSATLELNLSRTGAGAEPIALHRLLAD